MGDLKLCSTEALEELDKDPDPPDRQEVTIENHLGHPPEDQRSTRTRGR